MSTDIKVEEGGSFVVEKGDFVLITQDAQLVQFLTRKLRTFYREVFTDKTKGVRYLDYLGEKIDTELVKSDILIQITDEAEVEKIVSVDIDFDNSNRGLSFDIVIISIYSNSEINFLVEV